MLMIILFYREVCIILKMELLVKISIIFTINDDISISKLESLNVESFINQYFLIKILF